MSSARSRAVDARKLADSRTIVQIVEIYASVSRDVFPFEVEVPFRHSHFRPPLVRSGLVLGERVTPQQAYDFLNAFTASQNFSQSDRAFSVDETRLLREIWAEPRRLSDTRFPSAKGMFWFTAYAGTPPYEIDSMRGPCCGVLMRDIEPIAFADGSAERRHWSTLRGGNPLIAERDGVGYPVHTTWDGLAGVDR